MNQNALTIDRGQWPAFFDELAERYQGWAATVEVMGGEVGDQRVADQLPFQGISLETVGSQAGDALVEVGDAGTPFDVHRIARPRAVRAVQTQDGAEQDVEIESEDGTTTLIRLQRRPELPPNTGEGTWAGGGQRR